MEDVPRKDDECKLISLFSEQLMTKRWMHACSSEFHGIACHYENHVLQFICIVF